MHKCAVNDVEAEHPDDGVLQQSDDDFKVNVMQKGLEDGRRFVNLPPTRATFKMDLARITAALKR